MCGIVGVVGDIGFNERKAFKDMLHMDILRGSHSIGVASATLTGGFNMHKRAMLPSDFFELKKTGEVINDINNVCLIGHNRYATVGKVNNNTAHPFECGDLVGVHNGTLKARSNLLDYKDFSVDSENLYHNMANLGVEDTFQKMSSSINNAWSLAWINKASETLHLLRNDERPMCYCLSEDGKTLFFASEWWMLEGALWRNSIKHQTVYITNVDELYTINLPKVKGAQVTCETRKLEYTPPAPVVVEKTKNLPAPKSKPSLEERREMFKKLLALKGKNVTFCVDILPKEEPYDYFDCSMLYDPNISVRIYMPEASLKDNPKKSALKKLLAKSFNYFTGEVKKVHFNSGEPYVLLDWRTIVEEKIDLSELDLGDTYDNKGNIDHGDCAWCSDPLVEGEYVREPQGSLFCSGCVNDTQTKQTLLNMGYEL